MLLESGLCGCEFGPVGVAVTSGWDHFATKAASLRAIGFKTSAITRSSDLVAHFGDLARKGAAELTVATVRREV